MGPPRLEEKCSTVLADEESPRAGSTRACRLPDLLRFRCRVRPTWAMNLALLCGLGIGSALRFRRQTSSSCRRTSPTSGDEEGKAGTWRKRFLWGRPHGPHCAGRGRVRLGGTAVVVIAGGMPLGAVVRTRRGPYNTCVVVGTGWVPLRRTVPGKIDLFDVDPRRATVPRIGGYDAGRHTRSSLNWEVSVSGYRFATTCASPSCTVRSPMGAPRS